MSYFPANLSGCVLNGHVFMSNAIGANWDFGSAQLIGASFNGDSTTSLNFYGANLKQADFRNAWIAGANLTNADMTGALLTGIRSGGLIGQPANLPIG